MASTEEVAEKEESIRKLVRELPCDRRLKFFKEAENKLKDPDTYATLNYIFIAGLHHFYLGKWERGLLNIVVFLAGIIALFTGYAGIGAMMILAISVFELYALFKSQAIVQEYNNDIMEKIYKNTH